jgi:hypothetical protein
VKISTYDKTSTVIPAHAGIQNFYPVDFKTGQVNRLDFRLRENDGLF